jgi:FkbM family methyltransferase
MHLSTDIESLFRALLDRLPTEGEVNQAMSISEMAMRLSQSTEFRRRITKDPLGLGLYASHLSAEEIVLRYEDKARFSRPGYLVNYLGVATDVSFVSAFQHLSGVVEAPPIPCNNHAELVEWAAVLRAVDLACDSFSVVELGAGWGCWMVNSAIAAKMRGLRTFSIGVEGEAGHFSYIRNHCATNGISPTEYRIEKAVAGAFEGVALFPVVDQSSLSYGQEPRFFASEGDMNNFLKTTDHKYDRVDVKTIDEIAGSIKKIDLLHIDIQGSEAEFLRSTIDRLSNKVAYIVVGTHSRKIDAEIIETLQAAGWQLEFEKPTTIGIDSIGNVTTIRDGTQGWKNSQLFSETRN